MPAELVGSNLVVAAHHFNPSVFSQFWLVRNGIATEAQFRPGCLFSDQAVNVESEEFALLVVPPQLQFVPKVAPEHQGDLVTTKVGAIVHTLPHTPYTAIGLNFFWHISSEDGNVRALTRSLFFVPGRPLCQLFDTDDARFGAYFSRDTLGCRLKLDIKPVTIHTPEESREVVQFAFNYHLDLPREGNTTIDIIERQLRAWDEARGHAKKVVDEAVQ
jgi:hypothetical protein